MKLKIITSYKPGTWKEFSKRGIDSMAEQFPKEIDIVMYCEEPQPKDVKARIKCINKESLPVYGKGENIRDWIHVQDHCSAIDFILNKG